MGHHRLLRGPRLRRVVLLAGCALLTRSWSSAALSWPIACRPGVDCEITNFPDPGRTGRTALCRSNYIEGHEGTDIIISQESMDRGVDVLAADDGDVLWVFDGKYDRCPDSRWKDCRVPPGPLRPELREGTDVCTPLGPFCRSGPGECFWCFAGGNVVVIRHERGVFATRYDHLKKGSIRVKAGEPVKRGQVIARVGSAGRSTAPHLHFEVWGRTFYDPVDPWKGPCSPEGRRGLWADQPDLPDPHGRTSSGDVR